MRGTGCAFTLLMLLASTITSASSQARALKAQVSHQAGSYEPTETLYSALKRSLRPSTLARQEATYLSPEGQAIAGRASALLPRTDGRNAIPRAESEAHSKETRMIFVQQGHTYQSTMRSNQHYRNSIALSSSAGTRAVKPKRRHSRSLDSTQSAPTQRCRRKIGEIGLATSGKKCPRQSKKQKLKSANNSNDGLLSGNKTALQALPNGEQLPAENKLHNVSLSTGQHAAHSEGAKQQLAAADQNKQDSSGLSVGVTIEQPPAPSQSARHCFPGLDFQLPADVPSSTQHWWCPLSQEHAFLGFSYDVSGCPSRQNMTRDFRRMRADFHARYVRLYGGCYSSDFWDDVVESAWAANIGVYALIWFGFDGSDAWRGSKDDLVRTLAANPRAKFVLRSVDLGSEPLFDGVMPPAQLAHELRNLKAAVQPLSASGSYGGMLVALSDLAWGFQSHGNASEVFAAMDVIHGNVLPFFTQNASMGDSADAHDNVKQTLDYFVEHGNGKKVIFTQTGWPSNAAVWKPNSPHADASVQSEEAYFHMLDKLACEGFLKDGPEGGVGYFAHIWSDAGLDGWGILRSDGRPKFDFKPRTSCH